MNCIDEQKKELRSEIRRLKKEITPEQRISEGAAVFSAIESLDEFQKAKCIMAYWAMSDELPTQEFIDKWHKSKQIILPSVDGAILRLKEYRTKDLMKKGNLFDIPEPDGPDFTSPDTIDLILVPGVAFDHQNNRMGRGKAYYDQLLSSLQCFKIGIGYHFQLLNEIPTEPHDIKMNIVVAGGVKTMPR